MSSLCLCFIVVFSSDLFVYRDEKLTSQKSIMLNEQVPLHGEIEVEMECRFASLCNHRSPIDLKITKLSRSIIVPPIHYNGPFDNHFSNVSKSKFILHTHSCFILLYN